MDVWAWQCTTTGLDNSIELRTEKIHQAVTEIWVPQVWQLPAQPPARPPVRPPARPPARTVTTIPLQPGGLRGKKCTLSGNWGLRAFCILQTSIFFFCIWVRSRRCGCLVTWFCYHLIAKPGNKTAAHSWPEPYNILPAVSRQLTQYDTVPSVRLHDGCHCRPPFINIPASQSEENHLWGNWTIEHMAEQATTAISANESSWMGEWMKEISITVKSLI